MKKLDVTQIRLVNHSRTIRPTKDLWIEIHAIIINEAKVLST